MDEDEIDGEGGIDGDESWTATCVAILGENEGASFWYDWFVD